MVGGKGLGMKIYARAVKLLAPAHFAINYSELLHRMGRKKESILFLVKWISVPGSTWESSVH